MGVGVRVRAETVASEHSPYTLSLVLGLGGALGLSAAKHGAVGSSVSLGCSDIFPAKGLASDGR